QDDDRLGHRVDDDPARVSTEASLDVDRNPHGIERAIIDDGVGRQVERYELLVEYGYGRPFKRSRLPNGTRSNSISPGSLFQALDCGRTVVCQSELELCSVPAAEVEER